MDEYPSARTQLKIGGNIVIWVIAVVVLAGGISVALWGFGVIFADVKGQGDVTKTVKSAPYRIAAYEHFYDLCASVQSAETAIDAQYVELAATTETTDKARILANIAGLQAERARSIFQYNADARKSYTQGQFRASDLPYQIPAGLYDHTKGAHTSCTAG